MRICIYIPAYEAGKTLARVLGAHSPILDAVSEIVVIDNHSTDDTSQVALDLARQHPQRSIKVFRTDRNMGYGGSQKLAYTYCIRNNFDAVIMLHSDGQYPPDLLPALIERFQKSNASMVHGSRYLGRPFQSGMPFLRFVGNWLLYRFENFCLASSYTEFHTALRIYDCQALAQIPFGHLSDDYNFDLEMIFALHLQGKPIDEIKIPTIYSDEKSHLRVVKVGLKMLMTSISLLAHRLGIRKQAKYSHRGGYTVSLDPLHQQT